MHGLAVHRGKILVAAESRVIAFDADGRLGAETAKLVDAWATTST